VNEESYHQDYTFKLLFKKISEVPDIR